MTHRRSKLQSHPLPEWLQYSVEQYAGRVPLWMFPDLPPTANLRFERLDFDNRETVLDLLRSDASPFIDGAFKDDRLLYEYVAHQQICGPHSPKHGCTDWIVYRMDAEPVGLLHAYDISRETWALNHRRCSIGYAVASRHHGSGVAHEAVTALEAYLFHTFDMLMLLAYPQRKNERSIQFLLRRGYEERTDAYLERDKNRYFERFRDADAKQKMENRHEVSMGESLVSKVT